MRWIFAGVIVCCVALANSPSRAEDDLRLGAPPAPTNEAGEVVDPVPVAPAPPPIPTTAPQGLEDLADEPEVPPDPSVSQPYELARTLEAIQNQIIRGNRSAHLVQRTLVAKIAFDLAKVPAERWKEPRNARAVVSYVLSGGDPRILGKLLKMGELPGGVTENLMKGLYAYARDRNKEALELLGAFNVRSFHPGPGGHMALALATLTAGSDPARALAYLDDARLLAPGTLIEEAALRRAITIALKAENFDKFLLTASLYLRRFPASVYAAAFRRNMAKAFASSKFSMDSALVHRFSAEIETFTPERRKEAYIALAEEGILHGRLELTRLASQKVIELAADDPALLTKARLYDAAALVVSADYDQAVVALGALDTSKLAYRDRELLKAVLTVAERVRAKPAEIATQTPPPASAAQGKAVEMESVSPVVKSGRNAIATADQLLSGAGR